MPAINVVAEKHYAWTLAIGGRDRDAPHRRAVGVAIEAIRTAEERFAKFDFVNATFAAQKAWRAAAAYRDLARALPPGTSELEKGTKTEGASACASPKEQGR